MKPLLDAFRFQRGAFELASLRSPLYLALTDAAIADAEAGGVTASILADAPAGLDPIADAVPLRFLGALHRLVLADRAPSLARWFPTAGGAFDPACDDPAPDLLATLAEHRDEVVAGMSLGVQTNEVGRCASLAVGFTELLRRHGLPLRLLEIGSSAGLNLRWDRWRYESGGSAWGHEDAALVFADAYRDPAPRVDASLGPDEAVAERLGCDRSPIDPTTDEGALALTAFVWPDQPARHARLAAAVAAAREVPARVVQQDAGSWVADRLAAAVPGTVSVVFHSIVWQYVGADSRRAVTTAVESAGRRATPAAPVAWLRMEPGPDPGAPAEVRLRSWPGGGADELLARSGYHGHPVWRAAADDLG